ncbi:substrate-binding domain-containing protein [Pelatocladus sp. BLCC-F211]|uniref:substrate-binding domain-containing protein n=1 Tax=Pelatocladus sp. BLCC-F211 TaxID=3342752 RepID=UPI0035B829D2
MWQKEKKDNSIVSLALLLMLTTTPMAVSIVVSDFALAQSTNVPSFPLLKEVPSGTTVRIDGSNSMNMINQTMKTRFENQFPGVKVEVAANGVDAALQSLQAGTIDIAAISRGLTPEEKSQGLEQFRLRREKIAIIVGEDNPFKGNLTNQEFAKIFRGEITDWSEVGGAKGKIRVIDRPANSDVRESFRSYPAFEKAKFTTGTTATQLNEDSTVEVVKQLGKDGIGYVLANQVSKLEGVRSLKVDRTLPSNSKYPFSQPLVYVYKKNPSLNVASFLGFVTNAPGEDAVEAARKIEADAIAAIVSADSQTATTTTSATTPPSTDTTSAASVSPTTVENNITTAQADTTNSSTLTSPVQSNQTNPEQQLLLWSFLALILGASTGFILWFLRRRRPAVADAKVQTADVTIDSSPPASSSDATTMLSQTTNVNPVTQTTPSDVTQEASSIPSEQNTAKHLTPTVAASIAGATAIGAGSTLVSKWSEKNAEITAKDQDVASDQDAPTAVRDINHSSSSVQVPAADNSGLDLEAPVTVVNSSYPQVSPNTQISSDPQPTLVQDNTQILSAQHSDVTEQMLSNGDVIEVKAPTQAPSVNIYSPLPDVWEDATIIQTPLPSLSEITDVTSTHETQTVPQQPELELPDVTDVTSTHETPTVPQQPDTNQQPLDLQTPSIVINTELPHLPDVWENTSIPKDSTVDSEVETTPQQPEVSEDLLDKVADTAEASVNVTEEITQTTPTPDPSAINSHPTEQVPSTVAGIGSWATIYGISNNQNQNPDSPQTHTVDNATPVTTAPTTPENVESENIIVLTSRTPKWAYVSWQVSDEAKQALRSQGGSQFTLRLYDATDIDLSYQNPVLVQQYECEETTEDRYVAIPTGDRNYMAEIGYTTANNNWLSLARSAPARVFSRPEKDFWFIADAELIIHGATEPGSSVAVAGHAIKLKPDGTFHLRIPFTDSLIDYVMTATNANGQQAKTIRMHFSQENPEE